MRLARSMRKPAPLFARKDFTPVNFPMIHSAIMSLDRADFVKWIWSQQMKSEKMIAKDVETGSRFWRKFLYLISASCL